MKIAKLAKNISKSNNKNIALIGHMGSGKTILGKLISKEINYIHLDSDDLIEENQKKTISEIFQVNGEAYFRKIEEKLILDTINKKDIVFSLGGGSILSAKVRNVLKKSCLTIFLDINLDVICKRLINSKRRPLIQNTDVGEKIKKLDIIRRKYYLLADIKLIKHVDTKTTLNEFMEKYIKYYEKNY